MISSINKNLLPMKGHYFFYNAATAPVIPFLPTLAKQLGFSGTVVGLIYTVLPIMGMLAKPIMGAVADRFHCKKLLFLTFQMLTAVALLGINYIPEMPSESKVHFACHDTEAIMDTTAIKNFTVEECAVQKIQIENGRNSTLKCQMTCEVDMNSQLEHGIKFWQTVRKTDLHRTTELYSFTAFIPVDLILIMDHNMFFPVKYIESENGEIKPQCFNKTFSVSTACQARCSSHFVNSLLERPLTQDNQVVTMYQFWLFFLMAIFSWVGMAVVVSLGDAICFEMLEDRPHLYGNQRLWGSVGWGIFSVFAGLMVDAFSQGEAKKNYTSAFYLMLAMMLLDLLVSSRLRYGQNKVSASIVRDVGRLLLQPRIFIFLAWCIFMGMCTGVLWQFLFWLLEDLANQMGGCNMLGGIKTLEGLVMGIQCLGGELPFFFLSGWILKRIGHVNCMSLVLLGVGVRYILYSVLTNPWWVLPIELMNGITFGLFYATMASYASIAAPPGTEATVQGLVGAVFEGVGVSLGSLLGGVLYDMYKGATVFRIYGIASLIFCVLHFAIQFIIQKRSSGTEGKT